jgi:hypothetical protein
VKWSEEQLELCKQEYFMEVKKVSTKEGFWNDMTMFFVKAHKSKQD